jgi:tryptophan synthase beta chain
MFAKLKDLPDERGRFGIFGGRYVPELLIPALEELEEAFERFKNDKVQQDYYRTLEHDYAGRPTPLYLAQNLSERVGTRIYFKREDLLHTGAHKINNALGQALLAKSMGKKRLIAETGAGQHGLAVATAAAVLGLQADIYMGVKDIQRQALNAFKIKLNGGNVIPVSTGNGILKDSVNEAIRDWISDLGTTHYLLGSSVGPHPYPKIVREFQKVIGLETIEEFQQKEGAGKLPSAIIAAGSGGSNAMGIFYEFLDKYEVELHFVEGGGQGIDGSMHAAVLSKGDEGVLHGAYIYLLQDEHGLVNPTTTRSAGLNYPGRGPEISNLKKIGRIKVGIATDQEVFDAYSLSCRLEGIPPALETAHAIAYLIKNKDYFSKKESVVVNFSGRGEKDLDTVSKYFGVEISNRY